MRAAIRRCRRSNILFLNIKIIACIAQQQHHTTFDVVKMGEFSVKPQCWPLSDSILLPVAKALTTFGGVQSAMSYIIGHIGFSRYHQVELPAEASIFGRQELRGTEPPNKRKVPY